jgi:hypothetical protein
MRRGIHDRELLGGYGFRSGYAVRLSLLQGNIAVTVPRSRVMGVLLKLGDMQAYPRYGCGDIR